LNINGPLSRKGGLRSSNRIGRLMRCRREDNTTLGGAVYMNDTRNEIGISDFSLLVTCVTLTSVMIHEKGREVGFATLGCTHVVVLLCCLIRRRHRLEL